MAKTYWSWVGLALATGSVLSGPALAAESRGQVEQVSSQQAQQSRSVSKLFDELDLSPEQRSHCLAVVKQGWEVNRTLRHDAMETWHDLMATLRKPDVTLDQALSMQRKLSRLQQTLAEKRLETWFAMRKLLTPDQLDRLSSLRLDWLEEVNGEPRSTKPRRNDIP